MVFLATEPELKRNVALKVPRLEWLTQKSFRERFLREAIAVARLSHPGIISIYRFEERGSLCYIASQYVDGPNLGQWLERQKQPCDTDLAVRLVARLAEAVQHAHERGVLHRDLKPGNILLEQREDAELPFVPLITDFGLAKLLHEGSEYTLTGAIGMGTPSYMSPEQASGGVVSPATDVYALGMILRTLLTGRPPHVKEASHSAAELPKHLNAIIDHCLQKEPGNRYISAKALGDDLRRYLAGQPIVCARSSKGRFRWEMAGRRLGLVSIFALLSLVLFMGISQVKPPKSIEPHGAARAANTQHSPKADRRQYVSSLKQSYSFLKDNRFPRGMELLELARQHSAPEDLGGYAWRFVENTGNRESQVLSGHQGDVYCSRFSPDGKLLATSGVDATIRLWEIPSGQPVGTLAKHTGEVNDLSFSRDGLMLASAGNHGQIFLWDVASRTLIRSIAGGTSDKEMVGIEFSLDGERLYSGNRNGLIQEWELSTGNLTAAFQSQFGMLESIVVSPTDGAIAVTGVPPRVSLLKTDQEKDGSRSFRVVREFEIPKTSSPLWSFIGTAFSSDGKVLAAVPQGNWPENDLRLWDVETGRFLLNLVGHSRQPSAVAFGPDPRIVATAAQDRTIRLWGVSSGNAQKTLIGPRERIWSLAFSPQGDWLASTGENGRVLLWNLTEKKNSFTSPSLLKVFSNISWAPDGRKLMVCDDVGNVVAFGDETGPSGSVEDYATTDRLFATEFGLSPTLETLVFDRVDEGIVLHTRVTGRYQQVLRHEDGVTYTTRFSPNGKTIVVVDPRFKVTLIDAQSARILSEFQAEGASDHPDQWNVFHPVFSNSGRLLAIATRSGLDLWNLGEDGKPQGHRRLTDSDFDRSCLRFSPDDKTIVCGLASGVVLLIDAATLQVSSPVSAHGESINDIAFTHDNRTLLTASSDKRVKFWDIESREELFALEGYSDPIRRILFSPDDQALAVCTGLVGKPMNITIHRLPVQKGK